LSDVIILLLSTPEGTVYLHEYLTRQHYRKTVLEGKDNNIFHGKFCYKFMKLGKELLKHELRFLWLAYRTVLNIISSPGPVVWLLFYYCLLLRELFTYMYTSPDNTIGKLFSREKTIIYLVHNISF
jgi:hypothetical protein